jgi:iron complex outermembrane receptor protein
LASTGPTAQVQDNRSAYLTAPTARDGVIPEEYRVGVTALDFIGIPGIVAYDGMGMPERLLHRFRCAGTGNLALGAHLHGRQELPPTTSSSISTRNSATACCSATSAASTDVDQVFGYGTYTGPDLYVLATPINDGDDYTGSAHVEHEL